MEPVSRLNKLLEILRQKQAATQTNKTSKNKKTGLSSEKITVEPHAVQHHDIGELKLLVKSRLRHLSPEDIENGTATAQFIDLVLTWEFGVQLLNDPEFITMSKKLQETMLHNKKTKKIITLTLTELIDT
ncbi:MAG: hypothetical protein RPU35_00620 [Candidatus Sedimenticola sp. (ex Thyasira tokunagai)]